RATCYLVAGLTQRKPHLARPITTIIFVIGLHDQVSDFLITTRPRRRFPATRLVIGGRGKYVSQLGQLDTYRLDPEGVFVGVDELDNQRCGRSSSAAKKTAMRNSA